MNRSRYLPRPLYFVSGASAPADVRGLARVSVPLGVSLAELSPVGLHVLCSFSNMPLLRIFVDSGAFSEVDRTGAIVAPIGDAAWCARVRTMHVLSAAFGPPAPLGDYGPRVWVVAPDRVGDQPETLRRLALHADAMRACRALGARVIVPIQRGALTAGAFDAACVAALGFSDFVRGIPGNKVAMPEAELEGFLRARRPASVHLLGVGPRGRSYEPLTTLVRRVLGDAVDVSCDSNALTANAGQTNGRGHGPRLLTDWQNFFEGKPARVCSPSPQREVDDPWRGESARALASLMTFGPPHLAAMFQVELERIGLARRPEPAPLQMDLFDGVSDGL